MVGKNAKYLYFKNIMAVISINEIRKPYPQKENYEKKLWIPNFVDEYHIFYYDDSNDTWVKIGILGKDSRVIQISDTEPTQEHIRYWVDISSEPPIIKVKDYQGNWKEVLEV